MKTATQPTISRFHSSPMGKWMILSALILTALGGCHQDMYDQPKQKPLSKSSFYADGLAARPLPEGTIARGEARLDEQLYTGKVSGKFAADFPFPVTHDVLRRGQDRFNTFCAPCHGRLGDGMGMIVQRGFPQPKSYHSDSLRAQPTGYFFDVVTNGFGRMYSYAPSVPVNDRWAIVAYIRALQYSQHTSLQELTDAERNHLMVSKR